MKKIKEWVSAAFKRVGKKYPPLTIMLQPYPTDWLQGGGGVDINVFKEMEGLKAIITTIRTIRSENNIPSNKLVWAYFRNVTENNKQLIEKNMQSIIYMAKLEGIAWLENKEPPSASASGFVNGLEIFIPLEGIINKESEIARLQKEHDKLEKDLSKINAKLHNTNFLENAPSEVLAKEYSRQDTLTNTLLKVECQLSKLSGLV